MRSHFGLTIYRSARSADGSGDPCEILCQICPQGPRPILCQISQDNRLFRLRFFAQTPATGGKDLPDLHA